MGDENPIRTLGDYSKPSHEGYRNTIELPVGNNVVPLRSDTIGLVQNGLSFHRVRSEDPNQHLKDFLKLVESLDFDGANRERTRLCLFQFSLRDQASNWLESLPARASQMAFVDSRLESIEQFLNNFANQPNETNMNNLKSDDEAVDTSLVSPFPHSDNASNDDEVLNELIEYENTGTLRQERIINSLDEDDLAFEFMIGFRKFTTYLDPFLPMNTISRKAYNTIMVKGLEGTRKNLVAVVKDVYVFVGSFTYITDFVVLEDIGEFIMSDMAEVLMGRPFRRRTKLKFDVAKGLVSFTKIFDTYTYRMTRTIPRLKNFN
ncbi:hypothetical protein Tco_0261469 [Tanacetum coccineum]